jgi:hypothetical protein
MDQPYQVRPSIPTEDTDTSRVRQRKKPFEVRMTRGRKPVANHTFRLWTNYIDSTGGHDHDDTRDIRRADNDNNYGYFTIGQATQHYRPLEEITNTEGKFTPVYNASIFGDTMRIYLKSRNEPLLQDSLYITEKVRDLVLLGTSTNYTKVGGTPNHHGPPLFTRQEDDHDHWCTQQTADSLQAAIRQFYNWSIRGGRAPIIVIINDLSLPLGGRFDISGSWDGRNSQYHLYHRTGTSVDINMGNMSQRQLIQLTRIMRIHHGFRNRERPQIHYGFNGGN